MKVKFTKKRYYNGHLCQPGDIVTVDERVGRAYLNAHAVEIIKVEKGNNFYKSGRKREFINMPTMSELSEKLAPPVVIEEDLEELTEETVDVAVPEEIADVEQEPIKKPLKRKRKVPDSEENDVG